MKDTVLVLSAWIAPDIWFRIFHAADTCLETALLRSSGDQWAAFALAQGHYALAEGAVLACSHRRTPLQRTTREAFCQKRRKDVAQFITVPINA